MAGIVIQSHSSPLPATWLGACTASVRRFAAAGGLAYRWLGDELFAALPERLLRKTAGQRVVATDLARLVVLEGALAEGFDPVVWIDADVLVLDPERFELMDSAAQFGREVWVQANEGSSLRVYQRIHNAVMGFRQGNPVLPFYRFAANRILERYDQRAEAMAPQLIGPKLLALLHNAIGFDVLETAGMLSPAVAADLLSGGGPALQRFRAASAADVLAINLCASSVRNGLLTDTQMQQLVALLAEQPHLLAAERPSVVRGGPAG
ncbi:MAG TPA: hypothetical protein VIS76_00705 [Pseudomonadales bacterium]